ncbi:MAG: ABC transporter ATP-binding protein [Planctomycetota bacterium]|nr:MAG: ABC transporter ATP-binding protein [Planctomycetota bacterium]
MSVEVKIDRLCKSFGALRAVDDVSFTVHAGEVLGFLGPNGAGKSTTMKMLAGFLPPSSGTAQVCGFDVIEAPLEVKRRIGYLPEGAPSYAEMTPRGFLTFVAHVRGFSGAEVGRRVDAAVAATSLFDVLDQRFETLSKGFKRRVGLAQAILHDPDVLILDEPTDGLDPNQKHEVRGLIRRMAEDKVIILSTHILEEVDAVCTRAVLIAEGRIRADASPAGLLEMVPSANGLDEVFRALTLGPEQPVTQAHTPVEPSA